MKKVRAVHQLLPSLSSADAVGNQVRLLQQLYRSWGFRSEIFATQTDRRSRREAQRPEALLKNLGPDDVVVYHHSIRAGFVPLLQRVKGRKVVLYHNITPGTFFAPYEPAVARECAAGRDETAQLARIADAGYAFTEYSARELTESGFSHARVLPFPIDWSSFDAPPDAALLERFSDGVVNVLCVGRVEPNKRVDEVLRVFTAFQRLFVPRSRLVLVGGFDAHRPYGEYVRSVLHRLMPDDVVVMGKVSREELSACFDSAHLYLNLSGHEGYGVPLLEAMHRRVPVIANSAAAIPETLGGAGIALRDGTPVDFARVMAAVVLDPSIRGSVLASQERRLETLNRSAAPEAIREAYLDIARGDVDATRPTLHR